jgi:hypothetical protein
MVYGNIRFRVIGSEFRIHCRQSRIEGLVTGWNCNPQIRVNCLGCRVQGLGSRVQSSRVRV